MESNYKRIQELRIKITETLLNKTKKTNFRQNRFKPLIQVIENMSKLEYKVILWKKGDQRRGHKINN